MFNIKMADLIIKIDNKYDYVFKLCKDYIVGDDEKEDMFICVNDDDILTEQNNCESGYPAGYCESICVYRYICRKLIKYDAFIMHAACIEVDNNVYAFLAKSGTGKSTHIRLWHDYLGDKVHVINGDKPIIRKYGNRLMVFGTPWCGKEGWNINTSAPLKALCFIERGKENTIEAIPSSAVLTRIGHQVLMPADRDEMLSYLDLMDFMISSIPSYLLHCNMDISAAKTAYKGMNHNDSQ